jgi:hypothetical protein
MSIDNLGIGIMSSVNFKERYTACKLTWSKDFDNVYIFGGHKANEIDNNLISIEGAGEDWESCFLKQQLGLKHMYENNPNYDWYSISGCDNVLFKNKLIEELKKYNSNEDFLISQKCGIWTDNPYLHECGVENDNSFFAIAGGASFFVSNSLMKKCYTIIDEFNNYWTEISKSGPSWLYGCADVAFSLMVNKYFNIKVTENKYMFGQNPSHYKDIIDNENSSDRIHFSDLNDLSNRISTPISFHYIKPNEMEEIYKKYK